jgi:putative chitinase
MAIDRKTFFSYVRRAPFGNRLSNDQVEGLEATLAEWERRRLADKRWLAYMLATDFHESAGTMQPVIETRQPREKANPSLETAIARLEASFARGKLPWVKTPYWRKDADGKSWLGRGKPQVTHRDNYRKLSLVLDVDLVKNPDLLLTMDIATKALFAGMSGGIFTGKKLADFFNETRDDPVGARKIVNGTEKAKLIASYHQAFLDALEAADTRTPLPADVSAEAAAPDDVPPAQSKSLWAIATTFLTGTTSLPLLGDISNGYALGALALLLVAGGVGAWLVLSGRVTINRGAPA